MNRIAFFATTCALGLCALVACSSAATNPGASDGSSGGADKDASNFTRDGSVYDSSPSPESGLGELLFRPDNVYTGTDGTHTFKVPVAVYDSDSDLTVTASDSSGLTLAKTTLKNPVSQDGITDNGKYFMLTALKAGTYTLTATSKGRSAKATVTVSDYAANRYADGNARYNNGDTSKSATRACANCHVNGLAIDHSPAALATATDQEIGVIITTGVKPGPSVIKIPNEPGTQHKWTVTAAEKDGLVTYLRALDPRGFQ
jgi:mono/diheme cytochrome c family protein